MRVALEDEVRLTDAPVSPDGEWSVRQVKIALNQLGFYTPRADEGMTPEIDDHFRDALIAFQRRHGIDAAEAITPQSVTVRLLNEELARLDPNAAYIWRTVEDSKVRDAHALRDGAFFQWGAPPEGGHPGEDYNCRCWAEALNPARHPWAAWAQEREAERRAGEFPVPPMPGELLHYDANAAGLMWNGARVTIAACWGNSACRAFLLREGADIILENTYHLPPKTLPAFPDAKKDKPIGGRARWKDSKGQIYEWDYKKGEVEKYDKTGKNHQGGFDPNTGKRRSKKDKTKKAQK